MRPRYESPEDLQNEKEVRELITECWGDRVEKLPESYQMDCCGVDENNFIEWIGEIKCRTHTCGTYPTFMISLLKIERARSLSKAAKVPFYIFVRFSDGIVKYVRFDFYIEGFNMNYETLYGGRTLNTRDNGDIEPMVHIPIEIFCTISRPVSGIPGGY